MSRKSLGEFRNSSSIVLDTWLQVLRSLEQSSILRDVRSYLDQYSKNRNNGNTGWSRAATIRLASLLARNKWRIGEIHSINSLVMLHNKVGWKMREWSAGYVRCQDVSTWINQTNWWVGKKTALNIFQKQSSFHPLGENI